MEKITIEFSGQYNLILCGEVIRTNLNQRNNNWKFRLYNDSSNEEVRIPNSSREIKNGAITISVNSIVANPTFWSINAIKPEEDIYEITTFPNELELIKHLRG